MGGILPVKNIPGTHDHEFHRELEVKTSVLLGRTARASPYNLDRTGVVPKLNAVWYALALEGKRNQLVRSGKGLLAFVHVRVRVGISHLLSDSKKASILGTCRVKRLSRLLSQLLLLVVIGRCNPRGKAAIANQVHPAVRDGQLQLTGKDCNKQQDVNTSLEELKVSVGDEMTRPLPRILHLAGVIFVVEIN